MNDNHMKDPADPKAGEGTPGYGDQGPAGAGGPSNPGGEVTGKQGQATPRGRDDRGLTDDADADNGGAPSTEGGMQHGQDGAERQTTLGGGSSSTEE